MKDFFKATLLVLVFLNCTAKLFAQDLKVIAYNVEFGKNTSPRAISELLKPEQADIICFNEVPGQGWTELVGQFLGLKYSYQGEIASANHTNEFEDKTGKYYGKYKSILSKFPLVDTHEISLKGVGWSPATAVAASVVIDKNNSVQIFSLHIPSGKSDPANCKAKHLSEILVNKYNTLDKIILAGDFNDLFDSMPISYFYNIGFTNSWKSLGMNMKDRTTFIKTEDLVIDHIFFKGLKIKSADIIEEKQKAQSDHKPVWSVFELQQ